MTHPSTTAPHGTWRSPITADLIASGGMGIGPVTGDEEDIYWVEMRPAEGGRNVIVRRTPDGQNEDITPAPFNVRSRVHEYGGGAFLVANGTVYFSNFGDQRLYRQDPGSAPHPITPDAPFRYADAVLDYRRSSLICIREDHSGEGEAVNTIVRVALDGTDAGQPILSGNDFYSSPRLSPDGSRLAWLTWNHPDMPWDAAELWVAAVNDDGSLAGGRRIAGGSGESVFQPEWSPGGALFFVSDPTGWWNLYRWRNGPIDALHLVPAEFGMPQWGLGMTAYAFAGPNIIIAAYTENGTWKLAEIDTRSGSFQDIDLPYTEVRGVQATPNGVVFNAGAPGEPMSIVRLDLATRETETLRRSTNAEIDAGYLSTPEAIQFPTENGRTSHALYYPPANHDYAPPTGELPPLLVKSHGGPTGATSTALNLTIQYWTSRGFAVLDVNYGGSTGYGRAYRERLRDSWGITDVDDCVNGALHLVRGGLADGERLTIDGGSAGGYTTLCALTFRDVFKAGASFYGISDLEALAKDTHKFESRYLDRLIGPYPARRDIYVDRSPIHATDRLSCPVIIFQGLEDEIVPPNQAEAMVNALREKGLPVAYVPFEGEQHGFRRAENIKQSLENELDFFARVFGFQLPDPVAPAPIENL